MKDLQSREPAEKYWLEKLSGEWTPGSFHYDFIKSTGTEYNTSALEFEISGEPFTRLMKIVGNSDPKLHMVLVSQLVMLLGKYSGNREIIIGTPIYKQKVEADFINTVLPLRNRLEEDMTFKTLLMQVRQTINEAVKNQNCSMEKMIYELGLPEYDGLGNLFETALLLENIHDEKYIDNARCGVIFSFSRSEDALKGTLKYDTSRYGKTSVERIIAHFSNLLEKTLFNADMPLTQIDVFSPEEKNQLLKDFNHTIAQYPETATVHRLFEEQAQKTPDNIAVSAQGETITYSGLNQKSANLARILRDKGVKAGTVVALMVEPSIAMIASIIAIMKAGGAYLPIDITTPMQRVQMILDDSAAEFFVTKKKCVEELKYQNEVIDLEDNTLFDAPADLETPELENLNTPKDPVYVIYTSGSTGVPKGVMIEHRNIINYTCWRLEEYKQTSEDVSLQLLSVAFDGFCANLYPTILSGGKLVLQSENLLELIESVEKVIVDEKVTTLSLTPSFYKTILKKVQPQSLETIKFVVLGGEKAGKSLIKTSMNKAPHITLINEYGPTENTVTTAALVGMNSDNSGLVGKPISNNHVFILDPQLDLLPIGVPGELCVSGHGLSRGYLNNPELTAHAFVANPFATEDRRYRKLYRTGDIARRHPGGNIEIMGRGDDQVKIRGYRVELGEIASRLQDHHKIKDAVVDVIDVGSESEEESVDKVLCAFIVTFDEELDIPATRDHLLAELPDYMLPAHFIKLSEIPRTQVGKIDRKTLTKMAEHIKDSNEYVEPRTETQQKLVEIWKKHLELEQVGIRDNFFNVGGDSVKVLSLLYDINKEFGIEFKVENLYENENIEKFSQLLEQQPDSPTTDESKAVVEELDDLKNKFLDQMGNTGGKIG